MVRRGGGWLLAAVIGMGAVERQTVVEAAREGNTRAVVLLLQEGARADVPQADGATALHWAAHWNDAQMVEALVRAGASPNAANDYGITPMFLAATNGSAEILEALLEHGGDPNAIRPTGESVLMTAVRSGSVSAVQRLLSKGANPNARQVSRGQTPLMWAAARGYAPIVAALLDKGAAVDTRSLAGYTALMFAARAGAVEAAETLLKAGAVINAASSDGTTPLLIATVRGHTALARQLLERGAGPEGDPQAGYTPLHWAASRFEDPVTLTSIEAPGEWGAIGGIPDRDAKLALLTDLVRFGADVNAVTTKALPVQFATRVGLTPLLAAAAGGDAPVMRFLLAHGANAQARAQDGATAPILAASGAVETGVRISERERIDAIALALDAGVNIEAADNKGYRAMHAAATGGLHNVITFLLSEGADLNPKTNARTEKVAMGADLFVAGQTPLGIAEGTFIGGDLRERSETATFLRGLGAISEGRVTLRSYMNAIGDHTEDRPATPTSSNR